MARTSKTILNKSGESEHPSPLILEETLSVFHVDNYVSYGFVIKGLYFVEVGSLYAHFLESFYHKWVLNFVKALFSIFWDDHMIFIFQALKKNNFIYLFIIFGCARSSLRCGLFSSCGKCYFL